MKILIAVDMEGITGVTTWDQVTPGHAEYTRFRKLMTQDVNAAIRGACEAGADDIVVADGHSSGTNILLEELDPKAIIAAQIVSTQLEADDLLRREFAGVVLEEAGHAASAQVEAQQVQDTMNEEYSNLPLQRVPFFSRLPYRHRH